MIDHTIGCAAIRWLGACLIALGVTGCFLNSGFAQEERERASSGEAFLAVPDDWEEVASSARITVLNMIADQTQGNYEKLRTWKGVYGVRLRQLVSTESMPQARAALGKPSPLWQEFDFTMPFAIDIASESIYRAKETSEMRWVRPGSNEIVTIPNTHPLDERSVVTNEHYLHLDPKVVWPGFFSVQDVPEAQNKRAAFRDTHEFADRLTDGDLMDPRSFFGVSKNGRFDQVAGGLSGMMRGEFGDELKGKSDAGVAVYQAEGPDGVWYRLVETVKDGPPYTRHMTMIFSPEAGWNAVLYTLGEDIEGERAVRAVRWEWKAFDDVYVPVHVKDLRYRKAGADLYFDREVELQECVVNGPLEPSQFSYQGLGMKDGELVMDNITQACYILENGQPRKLADFDEQHLAPEEPLLARPLGRWFLTAISVVAMMVVVLYLRARRARARREDSTG